MHPLRKGPEEEVEADWSLWSTIVGDELFYFRGGAEHTIKAEEELINCINERSPYPHQKIFLCFYAIR